MAEEKEKGKPLTRKDVERKIDEHGGPQGLDLSGKEFEEGLDLSDKVLCGIILNDTRLVRANFNGSDLDGAIMQRANLQYATFNPLKLKNTSLVKVDLRGAYLKNAEFREAQLSGAQFQGTRAIRPATLEETDFRNANLFDTNFKGCKFYKTKLEGAFIESADITIGDTRLGDADWGSYVIGEEKQNKFDIAEHRYRHLKAWYTNSGYDDIAAKFRYREIEARRKKIKLFSKSWNHRVALQLSYWVFGHGEGWKRLLFGWIGGVIFVLAAAYYFWGSFSPSSFWDTLYYSATSFSALGYGKWAPQPTGWAKGMGAAEAIIGVFMMALLLVTFVRKWTR